MSNYDDQHPKGKTTVHTQNEPRRPTYGPQFTVQSEKEIREEKRLRKEQKKAIKANNKTEDDATLVSMGILGFDGDDLRQAREDALINASQAPLFSSNYKTKAAASYPHVYQASQQGGTLSLFGTRYALPAGTIREEFNDYEETTIPVPKKAPIRFGERLLQISELDSLSRGAFKV